MGSRGRKLTTTPSRGNESSESTNSNSEIGLEATLRKIEKAPFKNSGNGQWNLDIPGVGGIQILDERDSSRAGMGTGPAYSINAWDDSAENTVSIPVIYGSLNDAKSEARSQLRTLLSVGRRIRRGGTV